MENELMAKWIALFFCPIVPSRCFCARHFIKIEPVTPNRRSTPSQTKKRNQSPQSDPARRTARQPKNSLFSSFTGIGSPPPFPPHLHDSLPVSQRSSLSPQLLINRRRDVLDEMGWPKNPGKGSRLFERHDRSSRHSIQARL